MDERNGKFPDFTDSRTMAEMIKSVTLDPGVLETASKASYNQKLSGKDPGRLANAQALWLFQPLQSSSDRVILCLVNAQCKVMNPEIAATVKAVEPVWSKEQG